MRCRVQIAAIFGWCWCLRFAALSTSCMPMVQVSNGVARVHKVGHDSRYFSYTLFTYDVSLARPTKEVLKEDYVRHNACCLCCI
eukprot:SAG31_NODE_4635_length_3081_cov_2.484574_2_plen_84_part_00